MFFTNWAGPDILNPVANASVNSKGKVGGWFGWPEDAKMEALRDQYARSSSPDEQKKIAAEIQARVYEQVTYIPLGPIRCPERVAEVAFRRGRRPGDAGVLEYRQVGVERFARLRRLTGASPAWIHPSRRTVLIL